MKVILLIVLALTALAAPSFQASLVDLRCVDTCRPLVRFLLGTSNNFCPGGQVCVHNGCAYHCQSMIGRRENNKKRLQLCPLSTFTCAIYCPFGQRTDSNGCTLCQCNDFGGIF